MISTHAPRTGSDARHAQEETPHHDFNPRSPHGERRRGTPARREPCYFNPRSPHGERPALERADTAAACNFNPRSPHGERQATNSVFFELSNISTHAPRTGSDSITADIDPDNNISTHAPRTGSDRWSFDPSRQWSGNFNPRSPHGERQGRRPREPEAHKFQPTLPARGATKGFSFYGRTQSISTHAPRTGSDGHPKLAQARGQPISTHAPRTGSDPPSPYSRPCRR